MPRWVVAAVAGAVETLRPFKDAAGAAGADLGAMPFLVRVTGVRNLLTLREHTGRGVNDCSETTASHEATSLPHR